VPTALRVKRKAAQMSSAAEAGPLPITARELDAVHNNNNNDDNNNNNNNDDVDNVNVGGARGADKNKVDEAFSQFMVRWFFIFIVVAIFQISNHFSLSGRYDGIGSDIEKIQINNNDAMCVYMYASKADYS
jgi:hypothetical protein